jgi:hypothetical protein
MKKHIWTFWTKPHKSSSLNLGYILMMLNSIERARSYASDVTVYTDDRGKKILESFGFKDRIDTSLNDISPNISKNMFTYSKMFVLSQLREPVVYLDHDFLINGSFLNEDSSSDMTVEFLESKETLNVKHCNPDIYERSYNDLINNNSKKLFSFIDTDTQNPKNKFNYIVGYNCGFISVNNVDVVNQWAKKSIDLYSKVRSIGFSKECNIILERSLLYYESLKNDWNINTLYDQQQIDNENYLHATSLRKLEYVKLIPNLLLECEKNNPIAAAKIWKNMPIYSRKYVRNNNGFKNVDIENVFESQEAEKDLFKGLQLFLNYIFSNEVTDKNQFQDLRQKICEKFKEFNFCDNGKLGELYSDILEENYSYVFDSVVSLIKESKIDLNKLNLAFKVSVLGRIFLRNAHTNNFFGENKKQKSNQSSLDPQKEPSLLEMAGNFASAMKSFAGSGFLRVTEEQHAERMAICNGCEFWKPGARFGLGKCLKCGCTGAKHWIATSVCPINKWGAISKEEVEASKEKENAEAKETQSPVSQQADGSSQEPSPEAQG